MLGLLIKSAKKTSIMNRIAKLMIAPVPMNGQEMFKQGERLSVEFEKLYEILLKFPGYVEIIQKHHATSKDLESIAWRALCSGYQFAPNGDFVPVAVVSIGPALDFVLSAKEEILNYGYAEARTVFNEAVKLL